MLSKVREHFYTAQHNDCYVDTLSSAVVHPVYTKSLKKELSVMLWTCRGHCQKKPLALQEVLQAWLGREISVRLKKNTRAQKAIKPQVASRAKIHF